MSWLLTAPCAAPLPAGSTVRRPPSAPSRPASSTTYASPTDGSWSASSKPTSSARCGSSTVKPWAWSASVQCFTACSPPRRRGCCRLCSNPSRQPALQSDELLSAVDVVGGPGDRRVGHEVNSERSDIDRGNDAADRQCGPQLLAAVL